MGRKLISVGVDTDINRKTVIIFDPAWSIDSGRKSDHGLILEDIFPENSLFCGIDYFTRSAIQEGRVSPVLSVADLLPLNPLIFIVETNLVPNWSGEREGINLLANIRRDKRLLQIPVIVIDLVPASEQYSDKLNELGVPPPSRFSWSALREAYSLRMKVTDLVVTGKFK